MKYVALILIISLLASCSGKSQSYQRASLKRPSAKFQETDILSPEYTRDLITGKAQAPNALEAKHQVNNQLGKWFYGHGFGRSMLNIGTVVVFPPWALYLLGNAGAELAGYEPFYLTNLLPEKPREGILDLYDGVTSVPGRISATIADQNFVNTPSVKKAIDEQKNQNWNRR